MLLSTLPKQELPTTYSDHFLFHERLDEPWHCAEQQSGLGLLMAGVECDYFVNGTRNRVPAGQLFLVNRESRLAIRIAKKGSAPALLFFHSRLPDLVMHSFDNSDEHLLEENYTGRYHDFSWLERLHNNPQLSQTLSALIQLGSSCSSFASLKADSMIRNLFEKLLRENKTAVRLSKNIRATKASTRLEIYKRVSLAREWMEANCCSPISLQDLGTIASMNSQHFLRMFRQIYQITPHQYLLGLKLEKAKQLLNSSLMTVSEICNAIGFESIQSFTILFRKKFGISPALSRKILHFR